MFQRSLFMMYARLLVIAILIVGSSMVVQGADRAPNHGLASIQGTDNPGFPIMFIRPHDIAFPTFTHPLTAKNVDLALINIINTDISFGPVAIHEDSCKGPGCGAAGWLNYSGLPAQVPALTTDTMSLVLNAAGVISSGPTVLYGRLIFEYGPPTWSDTMHIVLTVADTIQSVLYDSIATAISIKLAVANNGNLGKNYAGNLNMNFRPPTECDTGLNSRGDAGIYLGDASPVIVRKVGSNPARASWSIFGQSYDNPNGFKPLAVPAPKFTDTTLYQRYFSGEFLSSDSLVKVRRTYYAPKTSPDSANFIVVKTQVTPNPSNTAVTNLQIGDAFDWEDQPTSPVMISLVASFGPVDSTLLIRSRTVGTTLFVMAAPLCSKWDSRQISPARLFQIRSSTADIQLPMIRLSTSAANLSLNRCGTI
jgi:hypothetical protein